MVGTDDSNVERNLCVCAFWLGLGFGSGLGLVLVLGHKFANCACAILEIAQCILQIVQVDKLCTTAAYEQTRGPSQQCLDS